jgi:zinc-ribbon domain
MYCPKCGTQNIDNASFCRACGANLSLVPQALAGHLPAPPAGQGEAVDESRRARRRRGRDEPPTLESSIRTFFMGLAFLCISLAIKTYMPGGHVWWFWMLIPAFMMLGSGVAGFARLKSRPAAPLAPPTYAPPAVGPAQHNALPPRPAADVYAPPNSVTENTTRLLDRDR